MNLEDQISGLKSKLKGCRLTSRCVHRTPVRKRQLQNPCNGRQWIAAR